MKKKTKKKQRGAVVQWLETIGYGADSCQKVATLNSGFPIRLLGNSVRRAVNGYPFCKLGKDKAVRGVGSACHLLCRRYSGPLTSTSGYGKPLPH